MPFFHCPKDGLPSSFVYWQLLAFNLPNSRFLMRSSNGYWAPFSIAPSQQWVLSGCRRIHLSSAEVWTLQVHAVHLAPLAFLEPVPGFLELTSCFLPPDIFPLPYPKVDTALLVWLQVGHNQRPLSAPSSFFIEVRLSCLCQKNFSLLVWMYYCDSQLSYPL